MVSSVLANAILNQRTPDIVGSFQRGQEIGRRGRARTLAGEALKEGGGESLDELFNVDPEIAFTIGEQINARNAQDINNYIRDAKIGLDHLNAGDVQGALNFGQQRIAALKLQGRDTTQTENFVNLLATGQEDQARQILAATVGTIDQSKRPASLIQRDRLLEDLQSDNPEVAESARIALKLSAPARGGPTPEEQVDLVRKKAMVRAQVELATAGDIERLKAEQKGAGKGLSERQQGFINAGVDAADSTANIRRGLELLDTVETGGINAASLKIKQAFGVEGADEGELSANLGISVLAQLKPIFGAAFTAQEGERLEKISAGFGRNAKTNKRLLKQALRIAERSADRAIRASEAAGDGFTANEIRKALEFSASPEPAATSGAAPSGIKFLGFE